MISSPEKKIQELENLVRLAHEISILVREILKAGTETENAAEHSNSISIGLGRLIGKILSSRYTTGVKLAHDDNSKKDCEQVENAAQMLLKLCQDHSENTALSETEGIALYLTKVTKRITEKLWEFEEPVEIKTEIPPENGGKKPVVNKNRFFDPAIMQKSMGPWK